MLRFQHNNNITIFKIFQNEFYAEIIVCNKKYESFFPTVRIFFNGAADRT